MPREMMEHELQRLQDQLLVLGSLAAQAVQESVVALRRRDLAAAKRLIAGDRAVNERRFALERDCLVAIATQQPMAGDLRTLAAILEIATELERIADYGKGIARISLLMGNEPLLKPLVDIPRMASKATDMLQRALKAFVERDAPAARLIPAEDDAVDALYDQVYRDLLARIVADPLTIDRATRLLWVAHNLERAADRVTNICERTLFTVTGEMRELDEDDTPV